MIKNENKKIREINSAHTLHKLIMLKYSENSKGVIDGRDLSNV